MTGDPPALRVSCRLQAATEETFIHLNTPPIQAEEGRQCQDVLHEQTRSAPAQMAGLDVSVSASLTRSTKQVGYLM